MKMLRFKISQTHSSLLRLHCQFFLVSKDHLPPSIISRAKFPSLPICNIFLSHVWSPHEPCYILAPDSPRSSPPPSPLQRSISVHLVVIGDLPFDEQVYTTSAVFHLPNFSGFLFSSISSVITSLGTVSWSVLLEHLQCPFVTINFLRECLLNAQNTTLYILMDCPVWRRIEYVHRSPESRKRWRKGNPGPGGISGSPCYWGI
jgi:hypothetical protein